MAQIFPPDIDAARAGGESPDELNTLIVLRDGLPDDFVVYHSAHWSAVRPMDPFDQASLTANPSCP